MERQFSSPPAYRWHSVCRHLEEKLKTVDEKAAAYPEVLGELGQVLRKLTDILKPYDGRIHLMEVLDYECSSAAWDKDGYRPVTDLRVSLEISYDPQKFHQGILRQDPLVKRTE
jgi:hypothetical protein